MKIKNNLKKAMLLLFISFFATNPISSLAEKSPQTFQRNMPAQNKSTSLQSHNAPSFFFLSKKEKDITNNSSPREFVDINATITGFSITDLAWTDFNLDGYLDLIITGISDVGIESTKIFLNNGAGVFIESNADLTGVVLGSLDVGDFNNNGFPDIAISGLTEDLQQITKIYRNNGDMTFSDINADLPGLSYSATAWGDFNNNGLLDLAISGLTSSEGPVARIYRNNGDETFSDINADLTGVSGSSLAWGDFNNNGLLDLAISGQNSQSDLLTKIYKNNGDESFVNINADIVGVTAGDLAWGDFNNDGFLDLAVSGISSPTSFITNLYKNNGNETFTNIDAEIQGVFDASIAWGDFNNNGFLDLAISGTNAQFQPITKIYQNDQDETFTDINADIAGIAWGALSWGDFNNSGYLDLAISGSGITKIYKNVPQGSPNEYTITLQTDGTPGALINDGSLQFEMLTYTVYEGQGFEKIFTALPPSYYDFIQWSGDIFSTDNPLNINIPEITSDVSIICHFDPQQFTLTYYTTTGGSASLNSETVSYGQDATPVLATANSGYEFFYWKSVCGEIFEDPTNPLQITNVTKNYDVVAYFWPLMSISGTVSHQGLGLEGVDVTLSIEGENDQTVSTGEDGTYMFSDITIWSNVSVTAQKDGYTFEPQSYSHPYINENKVWDFTAILNMLSISGAVYSSSNTEKDISEVQIRNSSGEILATTNSNGFYTIDIPIGWSDTLTPEKEGFKFDPASRSYQDLSEDQVDQNYFIKADTVTISGKIYSVLNNSPIAGVKIKDAAGNIIAITDHKGMYVIVVNYGWSGVLIPEKESYLFHPTSRNYQQVTTDQPKQDYLGFPEISSHSNSK